MGYWKSRVLPKIQKIFGKDAANAKKAAASEACKSFDDSKEEITKEFEEKKEELQPKVLEIFEASSTEIKTLVKVPKEAGLKKHSVKIQNFLDELVKIDFPGSKVVCEASSTYGPALVASPVLFIFEKVSTCVVTEEKPREVEVETPTPEGVAEQEEQTPTTEETSMAEKEIVVEEKEDAVVETEKPADSKPEKA